MLFCRHFWGCSRARQAENYPFPGPLLTGHGNLRIPPKINGIPSQKHVSPNRTLYRRAPSAGTPSRGHAGRVSPLLQNRFDSHPNATMPLLWEWIRPEAGNIQKAHLFAVPTWQDMAQNMNQVKKQLEAKEINALPIAMLMPSHGQKPFLGWWNLKKTLAPRKVGKKGTSRADSKAKPSWQLEPSNSSGAGVCKF